MKGRIFFLLIAMSMSSMLGCSATVEDPSAAPETPAVLQTAPETETRLVSTDNRSQITLPSGWAIDRNLHDSAEIQSANHGKQAYLIVLSEEKVNLEQEEPDQEWTLEKHSETTRSLLREKLDSAEEIEISEPTSFLIGDAPALQYEIRGKLEDVSVVYLHTTIETSDRFHQILAWTVPDRFDENLPEIEQVTQSFRELDPQATDSGLGNFQSGNADAAPIDEPPETDAPSPESADETPETP